jgi:hypothetical protein
VADFGKILPAISPVALKTAVWPLPVSAFPNFFQATLRPIFFLRAFSLSVHFCLYCVLSQQAGKKCVESEKPRPPFFNLRPRL